MSRAKREIVHSPHHNFGVLGTFDHVIKGDSAIMSTHLILKDLLEEPHVCIVAFAEWKEQFACLVIFEVM
jgi:anaphase-promoting complex subunit 1